MNEEVRAAMDKAAAEAAKEFKVDGSAEDVAKWMKKWYMKAGYKRLSRILLDAFGL